MNDRQISPQRKGGYRLGQILIAVGLLSFLSTFVSAFMNFGNFDNFDGQMKSMGFRAIGGMVLMMIGSGCMAYGVAGAAGSGLNLDPEQARHDLKPWARMQGGLMKDTLDEMGLDLPKIADRFAGGAAASGETLEQRLRSLHALHADGFLTDEEYRREKQELLDSA